MKNYQNYFNNKNKPKPSKLPPAQEQRRQSSQGVVPFEPKFPGMEDEKNGDALDYSSKVLTIQTLSAKLNGLEDQGTLARSASMSPSRRLGTSGGSIRGLSRPMSALSGEFQEVLTEEREGGEEEEEQNQQLLLQSAFGDNESEKGTNTFALTQVNQQPGGGAGAEYQQQLVPFDSNNENPDNSNINALVSRPLSPSRPITSSSTARRPRTSSASTRDIETPFTIMIQNIVKLEFIEMFQLISSIYTPSNVLLKNQLQKLELILPNVEEMRATHGNTTSPNKKNKKGSRPTSSSPVRSRPSTANNNTLQDPSQQPQQQQLVPFSPSSTTNIPSTVPLQPQQSMMITSLAADTSGTNAQYDIIGKYGFMKLMNSGKLLSISEFEVKEIFRNLDIKSSCYVNISNIYFHLWKELKKKNKLIKYLMAVDNNQNKSNNNSRPGTSTGLLSLGASSSSVNNQFTKSLPQNRIIMNEIVTPEERAIMILYKRMMRDDAFYQSLLDKDDNKGKLSAYEEYRLKMLKLQEKDDEDDDSDEDYNYGDEEEDEELLMADIERLKKMDVGRLMKYLTRRKVVKPQPVAQITDPENNSKPQSTTNSKPPSRAVSRPLSPVVPVSRPISRPTSPLVPAGAPASKTAVEKKV
jgi:hypothetical protein